MDATTVVPPEIQIQNWTLLAPDPLYDGSTTWTSWEKWSYGIVLGSVLFVSSSVKGLFIYYLTQHAPRDRPINVHIFFEQVDIYR